MSKKAAKWRKVVESGFQKIDKDLQMLVDCFHEVLTDLGEPHLAAFLPGHLDERDLDTLPPRGAQVISIAFQLLNLVEENAAYQAIRSRESLLGPEKESGLWPKYLHQLKESGISAEQILDRMKSQQTEPVLTGHPTEAKRWTVLDQHRELYVLLVKLENDMYTEAERNSIREDIKTVLEHLWRTGEILMTKPDVRSERRNALYYFREKFPKVIKDCDIRFRLAWNHSGYAEEHSLRWEDYPQLSFGSWVGGDRDGHPLVTADVTAETLQEMRETALQVISRNLRAREERFGLSIYGQEVPAALNKTIQVWMRNGGKAVQEAVAEYSEEPWAQYLAILRLRIPTEDNQLPDSFQYRFPSELKRDLEQLSVFLEAVGAGRLVQSEIEPLLRLVQVYGFHCARLDIRQNSTFHEKALAQLITAAGKDPEIFLNGDETARRAWIEEELTILRPLAPRKSKLGPEAEGVLEALKVCGRHLDLHGRAGLGSLIISMTRNLSDLLVVYLLAREVGLLQQTPEGPVCLLPVVPLFETIDDLKASAGIMDEFLAHPITQRSLFYQSRNWDEAVAGFDLPEVSEARDKGEAKQQVMLGYSDSNKDSGIVASQWALQEAQTELLKLADKHKVGLLFFHGRGGTVSRGAGPTHRFLEALPVGSLRSGFRVTEQGETVAQKFTNFRTAAYNVELLTAGGSAVSLSSAHRTPKPAQVKAMEGWTAASRARYRKLLDDPEFIPFYRQVTPIDALEFSRIGSRPSRRSGLQTLDDLRAIPWVFSWTQARFYLPNWFGAGSGLKDLREQDENAYQSLLRNWQKWPFLRYVLINIETGISSTNGAIMAEYGKLVEDDTLRKRLLGGILNELALTRKELSAFFGQEPLAERRPRFAKTIHDREEGLAILHAEQIRLLREWRATDQKKIKDDLLPQVLLTINAIASGLRTTG